MKKPFPSRKRNSGRKPWFNRSAEKGFTLIEVLITTVLVFLLFALVYSTFYSISIVTAEMENRMKASETAFNFLMKFSEEIKCMICEKNDETVSFAARELTFTTKERTSLYPVRITYFVEVSADNKETLFRRQENLMNGYSFVFPAIENAEMISFFFYDGEDWYQAVEKEKVAGVAIEADYGGKKIFFPVKIYREKTDEKEEKQ